MSKTVVPEEQSLFEKELMRYLVTDNHLWLIVYYHVASFSKFEENIEIVSDEAYGALCEYLLTYWNKLTTTQQGVIKKKDLETETCSLSFRDKFVAGETYFANIQSLIKTTKERVLIDASFNRWGCSPS